jgi:orotate phosphoribosyltransferase-like protein
MKVRELIEQLTTLANNGMADHDVAIHLHNTLHHISEVVESKDVVYFRRNNVPSYVQDHKYEWKKINATKSS